MNSAPPITVTALVHKPIAMVWEAWHAPAHIMQWCAASDDWHCPKAISDLRIGGRFCTTMAARDGSVSFDFEGVYTDLQRHKQSAYTMADGRTCKVVFKEEDGGTRITETFDPEAQNSMEMQRGGWQAILDRFKGYAEQLE